MKIALCTNYFYPSIGGCESVVQHLAEHFSKKHEVFVFTRRVRSRSASSFPYKVLEYIAGDYRLFDSHLRKIQPDVLLIYSDLFDFFQQILVKENKFRLIIALCGANWIYKHRSFANILNRLSDKISAIICHSEYDRDYKLCSSDKLLKKTVIIPNGIDLEEFDTNILTKSELAADIADNIWILNVSNFFPGKGQQYIFELLDKLSNPNAVYIQISSDISFPIGEQLENNWKKMSQLKYSHIPTKLIKNPPRDQVVGFFKQSNVFVFPSQKEVAPLVLLESMASELPWASLDVGNVRALKGGKYIPAVKDSRFYSVFDDRVKKIFARTIEELIDSPSVAKDGRALIEEKMTWDKILPQYDRLVEE